MTIRNTKYKGSLSDLSEDFDEQIIIAENSYDGYASRSGVSITQIISRDSRDRPEFTTTGSKFVWASFWTNFHNITTNYFTSLSQLLKGKVLFLCTMYKVLSYVRHNCFISTPR